MDLLSTRKKFVNARKRLSVKHVVYWLLVLVVFSILAHTFLTDLIIAKMVKSGNVFEVSSKVKVAIGSVGQIGSSDTGSDLDENKNLRFLFVDSGSKFAILYNFSLVRLNPENTLFWSSVDCCYYNLWRVGSLNFKKNARLATSETCYPITGERTEIPLHHTFITVTCKNKKTGKVQYQDSFGSKITEQESIEEHMESVGSNMLGTIFLGFESMTSRDFKEKMPFSADFLENTIGAQEFTNFQEQSVIASHSIAALLGGVNVPLYGSDNQSFMGSRTGENIPWVWSGASPFSYVSIQEEPSFGPTAASVLPSKMMAMEDFLHDLRNLVEPEPMGHVILEGPRHLSRFLANLLLFCNSHADDTAVHFTWITKGMLKRSEIMADLYLRATLEDLHARNILNKTMLVLFSTFGDYQIEGQDVKLFLKKKRKILQRRQPFLYVNLPDWFEKTYPKFRQAFLYNKKKAVIPSDIYRTLIEMDEETQFPVGRNVSQIPVIPARGNTDQNSKRTLFSHLPEKASCKDLQIQDLACKEWGRLPLKSNHLDMVTRNVMPKVIDYMNGMARGVWACENITLRSLLGGSKVVLDEDDGNNSVKLEIVFTTTPNEAVWEAALTITGNGISLTDLVPIRPLFNKRYVGVDDVNLDGRNDKSCVDDSYLDDVQYLCKCKSGHSRYSKNLKIGSTATTFNYYDAYE